MTPDDLRSAAPVWETVVVALTIVIMLAVIVSDKIGPDWVMVTALDGLYGN
jgi:hypothetical protein